MRTAPRLVATLVAALTAVVSSSLPASADAQASPLEMDPLSAQLVFANGPASVVRLSDGECLHPVDAMLTRTSTVFLVLEPPPTPYPLPARTQRLFTYIAQDIAAQAALIERTADGKMRLSSADSLYPPGIMLSRATFTLRHDGSLVNVDLSGIVHDGFRVALRARFDSIAARGGVGGFDTRGLPPEMPLVLSLDTKLDSLGGAAPLFALEIPIGRPATMLPDNPPPQYPVEARGRRADAVVLLTFVVDEEGRVREETIRTLPGDRSRPLDPALPMSAFERSATQAARTYRYGPAEHLGCRVPMWVQQRFTFSSHP